MIATIVVTVVAIPLMIAIEIKHLEQIADGGACYAARRYRPHAQSDLAGCVHDTFLNGVALTLEEPITKQFVDLFREKRILLQRA
jgi:hypothetical protein